MQIIDQLATSLNRRDEVPNQELAKRIAESDYAAAIKELVLNLANKNKSIQNDCIKVIYEVGVLKPKLVAPFIEELIVLLDNKNNRLQWGAMTALHTITGECPTAIYGALAKIIAVADSGSVITNDRCVFILAELASIKQYADDALTLLMERLQKSPANQLPMYAEYTLPVVNNEYKTIFVDILTTRLPGFENESQRRRIEKVLKKVRGK